ncbi:MAG: helix-hairpin-helix domain-containing protein [Candidatus Paceibacteria bacterium]
MRTLGLLALFLLLPISMHAAALININTADEKTLDSLQHIGAATAQKIIAYRTLHPFQTIEEIKQASTYITDAYYADIAPFITVGDTSTQSTTETTVATSSSSTAAAQGGSTTYVPPPSAISIQVTGNQNAAIEVPLKLSAAVTTKNGAVDSGARIVWSFGDGSRGEGSSIEKLYRYAGTYLVVVTATDGNATAKDDISVTVKPATVRIATVSGEGITLANDSAERLDLSGWRLDAGNGLFRIPEGTTLLPNANVLFPYSIINLPVSLDVMLLYPDGVIASRYAAPVPATLAEDVIVPAQSAQLAAPEGSYIQVQKVEPIISTRTSVQSHENTAVNAPAATTELAAAGAAVDAPTPAPQAHAAGFLHSPWVLSLVGVVILAGGAFILL